VTFFHVPPGRSAEPKRQAELQVRNGKCARKSRAVSLAGRGPCERTRARRADTASDQRRRAIRLESGTNAGRKPIADEGADEEEKRKVESFNSHAPQPDM